MRAVPLFGNGIAGHSLPLTSQRRVNVYFENRPDGDKTKVAVFGTPGLRTRFTIPGGLGAPRGVLGTENRLYAAIQNYFYELTTSGSIVTSPGGLNSYIGNVSMTQDSDQVMIVDGVNGYVFKKTETTLSQIGTGGFPNGARTCTFVSGCFVAEQPNTQKFWVSAPFDATSWDALAFASATAYTDNIVAVDSLAGNLVLFGERSTEFWQNIGTTPMPFAPILSATSEFGINAIWSRAHVGNSLVFLSQNPQGTSQVVMFQGYQPSVISTPDLDDIIAGFSTIADAVALSYVINGHPMYQLTFPTESRSFLYDVSTGIWSEVQSGLSTTYAQRHRAQFSTTCGNQALLTDYASSACYVPDETVFTDAGTQVLRELVTRHTSSDYNVISLAELYLDMETGVGDATTTAPFVSIECSKDNGRTWSNPRLVPMGAQGQYKTRVIARRFGSSRDFVFRFRMTDPVKFVVNEGAVVLAERQQ